MDTEELREIVTDCTRVECKLFLRKIKDVEAACQVSTWCHGYLDKNEGGGCVA